MTKMIPTFEQWNRTPRYNVVYRKGKLHGKRYVKGVGMMARGGQTFIYILIGTLSALLAFPSTARRVTMLSR